MEEKERYKYFVETNQLYDSEEDELYAYNLNNNKIISTLNQQDKQIKELEAENSRFRKYYQEAMEAKWKMTNAIRVRFLKSLLKEDFNYNKLYDYDFVKVAIVCSNHFKEYNWDYETILTLAHLIEKSYEEDYSDLSNEEQGYIQKYAETFIKENEKTIINIVEEK